MIDHVAQDDAVRAKHENPERVVAPLDYSYAKLAHFRSSLIDFHWSDFPSLPALLALVK